MNSTNIFTGLFNQANYYRKVIAHLKEDFFDDSEKIIFNKIKEYSDEYNKQPSSADIRLIIENDMELTEGETDICLEYINKVKNLDQVDDELLFNETEKFAQNRAFENALKQAVDAVMGDGESDPTIKGALPDLFRDALAISFTVSLGHDYFRDAPERYEFYTNEEEMIAFDVDAINEAFNGGLRRKSISCLLGRTNIGKCVHPDTLITIRNKKTKKIEQISIEKFHKLI